MIEPRRFLPAVALGGGAAGVLLAVPILGDFLRCAFCVGVMAGAAGSMKLWLDSHQAEDLSPVDAAILGACSGGASGAAAWVVSLPIRLVFGDSLSAFYESASFLPEIVRQNLRALYTPEPGVLIMSLPLQVMIYGMMGAIGGFVALQVLFPTRRAQPG